MPIYKVSVPSVVNGNTTNKHQVNGGGVEAGGGGQWRSSSAADAGCFGGDRVGASAAEDPPSNLAELTEADRDSELMRRDLEQRMQVTDGSHHHQHQHQHQHHHQKRMDDALGQSNHAKGNQVSNRRHTKEAIEEEIVAQHKREEELASTRQLVYGIHTHQQPLSSTSSSTSSSSTFVPSPDPVSRSTSSSSSHPSHSSETRIAQELMEQRRKEQELRGRWKELGHPVPEEEEDEIPDQSSGSAAIRRENSADVPPKVRPYECPGDEGRQPAAYVPANETPIEREIRLARDRENALREARGLEPLAALDQGRDGRNIEVEVTTTNGGYHHHHHLHHHHSGVDDSSVKESMKKLANNRLQVELMREKEREVALKSQGFINTISEERAGEQVKYVEVISKHQSQGHTTTTATTTPTTEAVKPEARPTETPPPPTVGGRTKGQQQGQGSGGAGGHHPGPMAEQLNELETVFGGLQKQQPMTMLRQKSTVTKPTAAERKILNELMEMQMREEELKSQRETFLTNSSTSEFCEEEEDEEGGSHWEDH